jgi:hypothetical protein
MKFKTVLLMILALLAGAVGGIASRLITTDDLHSLRFGPVRATSFDLVGENGKTIASLRQDGEFAAVLVFFDQQGQPRAKVGMLSGPYAPVLEFRGFDGKPRITAILVGPDDDPTILLHDKAGGTRWINTDASVTKSEN